MLYQVTEEISTGRRKLFLYVPLPAKIVAELEKVQKRVVPKGATPQELDHITLVYVPDSEKDRSDKDIANIVQTIGRVAMEADPIEAKVQGWAYFDGASKDGKEATALVGLVDAPGLEKLHVAMVAALEKEGVHPSDRHGFTAHFTFAYLERGGRVDELPPISGTFRIGEVGAAADKIYLLPLLAKKTEDMSMNNLQQPTVSDLDEYAGPTEQEVVGDQRRLQVRAIDPAFEGSWVPVGEAWQSADGELHGTGALAVLLFEPIIRQRYRSASVGADVSPLTVLNKRLGRATFLQVSTTDDDNEPR